MESPSKIKSVSMKTNSKQLPRRSRLPIPTQGSNGKQYISVHRFYILHEKEIKILFRKYSKRPSKIPLRVGKSPSKMNIQDPKVVIKSTNKSHSPDNKTYGYIAYTINANGDISDVFPPEMKDSDVFATGTDLNQRTELQPANDIHDDVTNNVSGNRLRKRLGRLWKSLKKIFTCGCCRIEEE